MTGPLGDRRSRVRFEIVGALWGVLELNESARLLNISNTGALIESPMAVAPESIQSVKLTVEDRPVQVDVRVRHSRSVMSDRGPRYLIGVEFMSPPLSLLHSIEQLKAKD
jgi:hypothetical protein